jgi:hypothetical protein
MVHLASMAVTMPRNGLPCCVLGHNLTLFSAARPKCRGGAGRRWRLLRVQQQTARLHAAVRRCRRRRTDGAADYFGPSFLVFLLSGAGGGTLRGGS